MHELERSGEFAIKTAWDLVDDVRRVHDCKEPKLTADLLFSYVRSGHADKRLPSALDEAVRGLASSGGSNDATAIGEYPLEGTPTNEATVEV